MEISRTQSSYLKGIAILMVVLYHVQYDLFGASFLIGRGEGSATWLQGIWQHISQYPETSFGFPLYFGFIGVHIFFVLSGYGLTKKYLASGKSARWRDMVRQILKILVPYWVAHPLIQIIDWLLKVTLFQVGLVDAVPDFWTMHPWWQYAESMLVIPRWFSETGTLSFVGTWWFVGVIVQFYLVFPILLRFFKRFKPARVFWALVSISLIYRFIISLTTGASPVGLSGAYIMLFVNFPSRLAEFALGMYLASQKDAFKSWQDKPWRAIALIVAGVGTLSFIPTMFVSDFLFALGIILLLAPPTAKITTTGNQVLKYIGQKSYLIYLYHEPTMKYLLAFIFPHWIDL